jgi:hypothetical protein
MTRSRIYRALLLTVTLVTAGQAAPASAGQKNGWSWADVPANHWAKTAIDFVAHQNPWMEDYGATHFRPNAIETRKYLAHAMVLAFAPNALPDPLITFGDMAPTDPFWRYANVSVKLGWLSRKGGDFLPDLTVTMSAVHVALVRAVGAGTLARGMDRIHTTDGYAFKHQRNLGALEIGMLLGLRYNHDDEALDIRPDQPLPRSELAWSLYRAYLTRSTEAWRITSLRSDGFANIHLGAISPAMRKVVEFGLRYVGYPYVYAGEWAKPTAAGYCCGPQPQGGFDCSGLTWWLMKAPSGGWDNTSIRKYQGWTLNERSSMDMARVGPKLSFKDAGPGDLLLYSGDGNGVIDHVDVYLGYGWALDSSNGVGGVTVLRVGSGWYRDHFVQARRIIKP